MILSMRLLLALTTPKNTERLRAKNQQRILQRPRTIHVDQKGARNLVRLSPFLTFWLSERHISAHLRVNATQFICTPSSQSKDNNYSQLFPLSNIFPWLGHLLIFF
jgi:hypothetical protein